MIKEPPKIEDVRDFIIKVGKLRTATHTTRLYAQAILEDPDITQNELEKYISKTRESEKYSFDELRAKSLSNHVVFKWYFNNGDFEQALNIFSRSAYYKDMKKNNAEELAKMEFTSQCSSEIDLYIRSKKNGVRVMTKTEKRKIIRKLNELEALINKDNIRDELYLRFCHYLNKIRIAVGLNVPSLISETQKGWVAEKRFACKIGLSFRASYGYYFPSVILHLLRTAGVDYITKDTVETWLKSAKTYWKYHYNYKGYRRKSMYSSLNVVGWRDDEVF